MQTHKTSLKLAHLHTNGNLHHPESAEKPCTHLLQAWCPALRPIVIAEVRMVTISSFAPAKRLRRMPGHNQRQESLCSLCKMSLKLCGSEYFLGRCYIEAMLQRTHGPG